MAKMAPGNAVHGDAYKYDLMGEYQMLADVAFKLSVNNLTDKHYADMLYRGHYIAGKPRTLQLTATAKF